MKVYEGVTAKFGTEVAATVVPDTWGRWYWEVHFVGAEDDTWTRTISGVCWLLRRAVRRALSASDVVELDLAAGQ